jgi:hypothetical protein
MLDQPWGTAIPAQGQACCLPYVKSLAPPSRLRVPVAEWFGARLFSEKGPLELQMRTSKSFAAALAFARVREGRATTVEAIWSSSDVG